MVDDRESNLDGLAIFKRGELDVLAGDQVAARGGGVAEACVAVVEAIVEVAVEGVGEGGGLATEAVGFDVATEWIAHGADPFFLLAGRGGVPPPIPAINAMDAVR